MEKCREKNGMKKREAIVNAKEPGRAHAQSDDVQPYGCGVYKRPRVSWARADETPGVPVVEVLIESCRSGRLGVKRQ